MGVVGVGLRARVAATASYGEAIERSPEDVVAVLSLPTPRPPQLTVELPPRGFITVAAGVDRV